MWPVSQCIMSVVLQPGNNEKVQNYENHALFEWHDGCPSCSCLDQNSDCTTFSQRQMQSISSWQSENWACKIRLQWFHSRRKPLHQRWQTKIMILSRQGASNLSLFSYNSKEDDNWSKYKELTRELKKQSN